jgi:hypothetical protein
MLSTRNVAVIGFVIVKSIRRENIIERVVFLVMYTENFYYMCCTRDLLNKPIYKEEKKEKFIYSLQINHAREIVVYLIDVH